MILSFKYGSSWRWTLLSHEKCNSFATGSRSPKEFDASLECFCRSNYFLCCSEVLGILLTRQKCQLLLKMDVIVGGEHVHDVKPLNTIMK
jgi:hypothetical protein